MNRREFIKLGGGLVAALSGCTFKGPRTIDSILHYSEKTHPLLRDGPFDPNGTIRIGDPAPIVCPRTSGPWAFYNGTEGLDPTKINYGEPNNPGYGRDGWYCHNMCGAIDINAFVSYIPSKNIHGIASHIEEIGNDIYRLYLDSKKEPWWVNKKGEKTRKINIKDVGWSINLLGENTNKHGGIYVVKYGDSWVEFFCPDGSPEERDLTFPIVPENSSGDPDLSAGIARYDDSNDTLAEITAGAWSEEGIIFSRNEHYHAGKAQWYLLALDSIKPGENVLEKLIDGRMDIAIRMPLFSTDECIDNTPAFMIEEGIGVRLWNPKDKKYRSITMSEQIRYGDSFAVIFRNFDPDPNRPLPFADTEILKVAVASISKQKIKDYCLSQGMIVERSPKDDFYMLSNSDASEGPESSRYNPNLKLKESVTVKIAGRSNIVVEGVKECLEEAGFKVTVTDNPYEADVNVEEKALQYPHYFGKIAWDPFEKPEKNTWGYYNKALVETCKKPNWIQRISGTHLDGVGTTVVSRYNTLFNQSIQVTDAYALEAPTSNPAFLYALRHRA